MSILEYWKKNDQLRPQSRKEAGGRSAGQCGAAFSKRIELTPQINTHIRENFIAFDVETTGLSPTSDRIVELGAVIFSNGMVQKTFSSLVNPGVFIPASASAVNHITNAMLASAPSEQELYPQLMDFLGGALSGNIIMCAHNAKFDFSFLCNTLSRLGFQASFHYVDTLSLSRKYLRGLTNYKQNTIEAYFGLTNSAAHRAASDAENCGHILCCLLDAAEEVWAMP